nr:ATP-binding cassette domain-containing protein [Kallotenue papyrolyticum]
MNMIELRDLRKIYRQGRREIVALDGVNLDVRQGEIFGVLGQSGAGKSTLIRCVNLLERPSSGSVRVAGQELTNLPSAELRRMRQRIGMIFQHFNLLSSRSVAENVAFPLEVMGVDRVTRQRRVAELLRLVGLEDRAHAYPSQLSGGQKQRVGIARALAGEPQVLLSDEATSALDPQTTRAILELLKELNRRLGLTILLITHELNVVKRICDSVAIMHAGRIVDQGSVVEVLGRSGALLPEGAADLRAPTPGAVLVTITFLGENADRPIITTMARRFGIDANILGGAIETIGSRRLGQLQVELTGERRRIDDALAFLRAQGLELEVIEA